MYKCSWRTSKVTFHHSVHQREVERKRTRNCQLVVITWKSMKCVNLQNQRTKKTNFDFHYRNIATVCLMLTEKIRFFKIYFQGMIRIYIFECWPQQRTYTRRVFGCFSKRKIARGFGKKSVTYRYRVTL